MQEILKLVDKKDVEYQVRVLKGITVHIEGRYLSDPDHQSVVLDKDQVKTVGIALLCIATAHEKGIVIDKLVEYEDAVGVISEDAGGEGDIFTPLYAVYSPMHVGYNYAIYKQGINDFPAPTIHKGE